MIFGFQTYKKSFGDPILLKSFINETNERFKGTDFFKNPFKNAEIKELSKGSFVLYLEHGYINPALAIGIISIVANYFLSVWVAFPIFFIFLFVSFMFSKYGIYAGLVFGLRKKGFKGKIELIKQKDLSLILFQEL